MSLSKTLWFLIVYFSIVAAFFTVKVIEMKNDKQEAANKSEPIEIIKVLN